MATVTDTATGSKYEGVTGNTLEYYIGEGSRFEIEYEEGEARPESAPAAVDMSQPEVTGVQTNGQDGDPNGGDLPPQPFAMPESAYLASDGVVYDKADQRVDPQPTPEQLAALQH